MFGVLRPVRMRGRSILFLDEDNFGRQDVVKVGDWLKIVVSAVHQN